MFSSGIGNDSSFGTEEFNSCFNVMTMSVIPSGRPNITSGFILIRQRISRLRPVRLTLFEERRCVLRLVQGAPQLRWFFGKPRSLPDNLTVPFCNRGSEIVTLFRRYQSPEIHPKSLLASPSYHDES